MCEFYMNLNFSILSNCAPNVIGLKRKIQIEARMIISQIILIVK